LRVNDWEKVKEMKPPVNGIEEEKAGKVGVK